MDEFVGSVALIRHPDRGEGHWLGIDDQRHPYVALITAQRLQDESYRECIDREIAWVLKLDRGRDYIVSSVARLHFVSTVPVSGSDEPTKVAAEFFVVDLYGRRGCIRVDENPETRWLTSAELLDGSTADGRPVTPLITALLRAADVIADNSGHRES